MRCAIRAAAGWWCAARAGWRWARCWPARTDDGRAITADGQILRRMSVQDDLLEARLQRRRHEAFEACQPLLDEAAVAGGAGRRRAPVRRRGAVLLLPRRPAAAGGRRSPAAGRDVRGGGRVPQVRRHADRRLRPGLRHRGSQRAGRLCELHELRGGECLRDEEDIAASANGDADHANDANGGKRFAKHCDSIRALSIATPRLCVSSLDYSPAEPSDARNSLISPAAWALPWVRAASMPSRR